MMVLGYSPAAQAKSRPKTPQAAVRTFFTQLKARQYASLYEFLPSQLQQQITREQLAQNLKRLESFIEIEKMDIARIQKKGEFAVIDTTIFGKLKRPLKIDNQDITDGRVTVQQYLFLENGQWKIATADNRTRDFFLKKHPEFRDQFQFSQPIFELKRDGKWVAMGGGREMTKQTK